MWSTNTALAVCERDEREKAGGREGGEREETRRRERKREEG